MFLKVKEHVLLIFDPQFLVPATVWAQNKCLWIKLNYWLIFEEPSNSLRDSIFSSSLKFVLAFHCDHWLERNPLEDSLT